LIQPKTSTAKPFCGEALGSLLVRCAWGRGETVSQFVRSIWRKCDLMTRDIDRAINADASQAVADAISLPLSVVQGMQLESWMHARRLDVQRHGYATWITPVGVYHRARLRYGQLYCPQCLDASACCCINWRLSHQWMCVEHGEYLLDACPHCDMPFVPYRHDSMIVKRCAWCWRRLADGVTKDRPSASELTYQRHVDYILNDCTETGLARQQAMHRTLTTHATKDARFSRSGEPWSWWRISERTALLAAAEAAIYELTVLADQTTLIGNKRLSVARVSGQADSKVECRSHRAHRLLQAAKRYQPPRKKPAKAEVIR